MKGNLGNCFSCSPLHTGFVLFQVWPLQYNIEGPCSWKPLLQLNSAQEPSSLMLLVPWASGPGLEQPEPERGGEDHGEWFKVWVWPGTVVASAELPINQQLCTVIEANSKYTWNKRWGEWGNIFLNASTDTNINWNPKVKRFTVHAHEWSSSPTQTGVSRDQCPDTQLLVLYPWSL